MSANGAVPDEQRRRRHRNERIAAAVVVTVLAGVAAGIVVWKRAVDRQYDEERTYIPKPAVVTPAVELLAEYVRIDTSTPEGAARGARWIAAQLDRRGIRAQIIESLPGRLNVYARIRGRRAGDALLLFNHVDVVPPGGGWQHPPFEAKIVANQMYGRGTIDMKALAICQLLAMSEVAESGRLPEHDIVFLATPDEETGSAAGMKWIVENRRDLLDGVTAGITEGGVTEMMSESMTYFGIEIGGKEVVQLTLESGTLEAMQQARIALEPWIASREAARVLPEVRSFFRQLAPTRYAFRHDLADIDATVRNGNFWKLPASYRDLVQNSLWVGAPRRTAGGWEMRVRLVNLPDENPDARIEWLRETVSPHGARIAAVESKSGPTPIASDKTRLFEILAARARERYRVTAGTQLLYQSTSDSRFLRPLGIAAYGVCPYPVDYFQSVTIHRANERIRLDYFHDGVEYMSDVVQDWAWPD